MRTFQVYVVWVFFVVVVGGGGTWKPGKTLFSRFKIESNIGTAFILNNIQQYITMTGEEGQECDPRVCE